MGIRIASVLLILILLCRAPASADELTVASHPDSGQIFIRPWGQEGSWQLAGEGEVKIPVASGIYAVRAEHRLSFFYVEWGEMKAFSGTRVEVPMHGEADWGHIAVALGLLLPVIPVAAWWAVKRVRKSDHVHLREKMAAASEASADSVHSTVMAAGGQLLPGTKFGAYKIVDLIARGGMGAVYEVEDGYGDHFALKLPDPQLMRGEEGTRFRREIEIAQQLLHPHIVRYYGSGLGEGALPPYIVLELVDGGSMKDLFANERPMSLPRVYYYIGSILDALGFGHARGIIHRDIKPANILVSREGIAKIADYGIARALEMNTVTATAGVIGTPTYMAPEQIKSHRVDERADLYAVGVMLFEALTGRPPFEAADAMNLMFLKLTQTPMCPSELNPLVPHELDAVVLKALASEPDNRYPSAHAFLSALQEVQVRHASTG